MALRIGRGSNHRMLSLPQIDPVALTLSVALRLMSQRDESNGSATKDSTSEPGSDRVNRGMSHKHRFYQHPPGIKVADARVVNLRRESCARLTRSLPLSGSDIECCIAANASSTRVKRLRNIRLNVRTEKR